MRRSTLIVTVLLVFGLVGIAGYFALASWRTRVIQNQHQTVKQRLDNLIEQGDFDTAWAALTHYQRNPNAPAWPDLRLAILEGRRNIPDLIGEFRQDPTRILPSEGASLLVARAFLHQDEDAEFQTIRSHWMQQVHNTNAWQSLQLDQLLRAGQTQNAWDAITTLESAGELGADTLIKRAMIKASTNAVAALEDLDQAVALEPDLPEVRSFRAQVLERLGDIEMARVEYAAAHLAAPENPLWRDQLAEFYRRRQKFDFALQTWAPGQTANTPDFVWLKSAFWAQVASPYPFEDRLPSESSPLAQLAIFIRQLPSGALWDEAAFASFSDADLLAQNRQEIYWLRILEHLRQGAEQDATRLLAERPFQHGLWDVYLHELLKSVLHYRQTDRFTGDNTVGSARMGQTEQRHTLINQVAQFRRNESLSGQTVSVPASLNALLKGPNAFAASLLAAGWRHAALTLLNNEGLDQRRQYPSWFHYGIAQLLRTDRNATDALAYLEGLTPSPDLSLLRGEILIGEDRINDATPILQSLAEDNSAPGAKAAWLLAIQALGSERFSDALALIDGNPQLKTSVRGEEIRAKAAQLQGNTQEATETFLRIADESPAAQRYLADVAFRAGNLEEAAEYIRTLLLDNPSDLTLLGNLEVIETALEGQP